MTIDDKTADGLLDLLSMQMPHHRDVIAASALFRASEDFTRKTGENEFVFVDRAMRLHIGTLFKLDRAAARDYIAALMDRLDPTASAEAVAAAEDRRERAFRQLFHALKLIAADPAGSA